MSNSAIVAYNTPPVIAQRYAQQGLSWAPVLAFLPARFGLALLAQLLTAAGFWLQGAPNPWSATYRWWMVYGTLTDMGCVALLFWLTRREDLRIIDLLGLDQERLLKQLRYLPGYLLLFIIPVGLTSVISSLFYGTQPPPQVAALQLPLWAKIYSVTVWPAIWCFTEELVYLGYLLPRVQVLTKQAWRAALLVALVWGAQHIVIPFMPDAQYLIARFLTALVTVGGLTLIFVLWGRRMIPAIGVHWLADVLAAFLANFLT